MLKPEIGKEYDHDSVEIFYLPDVTALHYVLIVNNEIAALRVREDYNPNIFADPAEVWVGAKGQVKSRGDKLAKRTKPVPLFVKKRDCEVYTFMGEYNVLNSETDGEAVRVARIIMEGVHDQGVSRIVYLKKV